MIYHWSIDDPAAGAKEYARLATRHADAYEWLNRLAEGSMSKRNWMEYRIDPAR